MHFGLVAFDIFAEMYREELDRAGQPGWPAKASVAAVQDIPASIIANNIHGLDIDLRAVQLSTLTLLLRARTLNPKCAFTGANLACANVEEITGGRLEEFIKQAKFTHPIYERILRALAIHLKDSDNLGSLLRLEQELERLIAEERRKVEAGKQFELSFRGLSADDFKTQEGIKEFFDILSEQVLRHLDDFVRASRAAGSDPGHFVSEAAKGLRFLRLLGRRYDVVATNPPYLDSRDYSAVHKAYLEDQFPSSKRNLFAAFIQRCLEFAKPQGLVAMITGQSFMFISSYETLRADLFDGAAIETLAQFDYHLFKERVDTAAFVLRREPDKGRREEQGGVYFRLVKELDSDGKRRSFEAALTALRNKQTHPLLFKCVQRDFDAIPGKPWTYWPSQAVRGAFRNCKPLKFIADPKMGTRNNRRFLRYRWEIGLRRICRNTASVKDAKETKCKWFPYMKGGGFRRWYGNQDYIVNYGCSGLELKEEQLFKYPYLDGNTSWIVPNEDCYFQRGITYSALTSGLFSARLSPGGFVFDVAGSSLFPSDIEGLLGLLNSKFAGYVLRLVNPTVNIQIGDVGRIPISPSGLTSLADLVQETVEAARLESSESETAYEFVKPLTNLDIHKDRAAQISAFETEIDCRVAGLYGLSKGDLQAIEQELAAPISTGPDGEHEPRGEAESEEVELTPDCLAESWLSYSFGTVLGRFPIGVPGGLGRGSFPAKVVAEIRKLVDSDGIMTSDENHPQDIVKRMLKCLELMLGRDPAHAAIRTATEDDGDPEDLSRDWVDRRFWKYHHQLYRKRPVYWPLQSPKKKFTVWVFHEQFSKDTLFRVKDQFVQVKINWLNGRIKDLKPKVLSSDTRDRRAAEKEISQLSDVLDDVQEFAERLKRITERGYTPHIDDGVLLNAAPLWELLPAWKDAETAWEELEAGDYDWAQQAMEYWPARVKKACQTNKSFAIAHGLA